MNQDLSPEAQAVIAKAIKLFALASNNPNEAEASSALAKGMELLAAHNLDVAMVGKSGQQGSKRKDYQTKGGLYQWQRDVWQHVAELNFCMYWSIRGLKKGQSYEHRVLGRHENVIGTQVMGDYLCQTTERLAQEWAKERDFNVFCSNAIAYREGVASRVCERLWTLRRDRMKAEQDKKAEEQTRAKHPSAAPGTSLVLADVVQSEHDLNIDYIYEREPGTTARERAVREARQAAADAEADRALQACDEAEARDPSIRAARLVEEERRNAKFLKKWAKNEAKYRKSSYRERAETPQEKRRNTEGYRVGYERGADIGLDRQVSREQRRRIE